MQGIKKRWVYNYIVITLAILLVIETGFMIAIKNYYYGNVSALISYRANHSAEFYHNYLDRDSYDIQDIADRMSRDFSPATYENLEFQILDIDGSVIVSSSGFQIDKIIKTGDVIGAIDGSPTTWNGKNDETNEPVMASSSPLKDPSGEVIGILRYVTSLREVNNAIAMIFAISMFFITIIILIMMAMSLLFSKSIINPINEINGVAQKMAEGQFTQRIEKHYNDEIGELADTLNYMAGEIVESANLKNEFISSISHELRTPLTSIKGWSETILSGDLEDKDETKMGLNIIVKETTRLSQMVEELLDFSKMESGRIVLHLEEVNIEEELDEIYSITKARASKDRVNLIYNRPEKGELPDVMADRNRLKQVFINVIDNAIKFTEEEKSVYMDVEVGDEAITVIIRDEGIGIPAEEIEHISEKFYKGKSKKSGSGIGLAISDEIMNLHKGELKIESKDGEGTQVTIKIPINKEVVTR